MFEFSPLLRLKITTVDFEQGVKNISTQHCPTVIFHGCLFHYGQKFISEACRPRFEKGF